MADFVSFKALLNDKSLEASTSSLDKAAPVCASAMAAALELSFSYAPIDRSAIEKIALRITGGKNKSLNEIASALRTVKQGALEQELAATVKMPPSTVDVTAENYKAPKASPVEFAISYLMYCIAKPILPQVPLQWAKPAAGAREVRFAANTQGWMIVKKVDLSKAESKEVVAGCAGIYDSSRRKLPELLCKPGQFGQYEELQDAFLNKFPQRKSFARLPEILEAAAKEGTAGKLSQIAGSPIAGGLFILKCFETAGFAPFITLDSISGVYPELKIPKPRGNFGGKKKK